VIASGWDWQLPVMDQCCQAPAESSRPIPLVHSASVNQTAPSGAVMIAAGVPVVPGGTEAIADAAGAQEAEAAVPLGFGCDSEMEQMPVRPGLRRDARQPQPPGDAGRHSAACLWSNRRWRPCTLAKIPDLQLAWCCAGRMGDSVAGTCKEVSAS